MLLTCAVATGDSFTAFGGPGLLPKAISEIGVVRQTPVAACGILTSDAKTRDVVIPIPSQIFALLCLPLCLLLCMLLMDISSPCFVRAPSFLLARPGVRWPSCGGSVEIAGFLVHNHKWSAESKRHVPKLSKILQVRFRLFPTSHGSSPTQYMP